MAFYAGQRLKASSLGQLSTTAQYQAASTQAVANGTDTVVAFGTDVITSSYFTKGTSGAGHKFTLNASGLVAVSVTLEFAANATGERACHIENSLGLWHCAINNHGDAGQPCVLHCGFTKYLTSGDYIQVEAYQTSGGSLNLDANSLLAIGRIDLAFILKE